MRARKKLSAKDVVKANVPDRYGDGGGLELQVSQWKTKSWLFRYLEQNFSVLPQELGGRSLAFSLLRTMRLSLRKIERYGVGR